MLFSIIKIVCITEYYWQKVIFVVSIIGLVEIYVYKVEKVCPLNFFFGSKEVDLLKMAGAVFPAAIFDIVIMSEKVTK